MLAAAEAVVRFVRGKSLDEYRADEFLRSAVERQIEIIGEAGRHVSRPFQAAHPEIPWQKIAAQRHVLAHEYGEIEHERIWRVAAIHVPDLIAKLKPLIPIPPGGTVGRPGEP